MDESKQASPGADPGSIPDSAKERAVFGAGRAALVTANFLVAGLSGLIAIWAVGPGKVLLSALFGTAIVVFVGQLVFVRLRASERRRISALEARHRAELAAVRREVELAVTAKPRRESSFGRRARELEGELSALRQALLDMCAGYPALYRDDLQLTYIVGSGAEQDVVVEQRDIMPGPGGLPFLLCRLTAPMDASYEPLPLRELDLVTRTNDDQIFVRPFALSERQGLVRCLYVFTPSITTRTTWFSRYRMPRLWDDFRGTGQSELTWTPVPRSDDRDRSVLEQFRVTFEFEAGNAEDVVVRDDRGRSLDQVLAPDGRIRYHWSQQDPEPRTYSWQLQRIAS